MLENLRGKRVSRDFIFGIDQTDPALTPIGSLWLHKKENWLLFVIDEIFDMTGNSQLIAVSINDWTREHGQLFEEFHMGRRGITTHFDRID